MPDGSSIGKAYVQIVPTTKGIGAALGSELGPESEKAGKQAGGNIAGFIKRAIAAAGIGAVLKKVVGDALAEGAALQQSIGGIETLFGAGGANSVEEYAQSVGKSVDEVQDKYTALKASEEKMLGYADAAWKTAGLSANEYMETSTSVAAALLSSLDGDTNAAAEAANNAVIAMSDNANKMGTDMQSIMNAYQGFAKGQYTMLDNLKLGYGGTKGEMERLLADAEKLSGVHYDIDNLADVYNAISVIQDKLGITGTTAKEAATTFSGSMASMKAAASNVLGKLAIGEDFMPALEGLLESVKTFFIYNFVGMLSNVLRGLPGVGEQLLGLFQSMLDVLPGLLRTTLDALMKMITNLVTQLPSLVSALLPAITMVFVVLARTAPELISAFTAMLPELITSILEYLPELISSGIRLLMALAQGLVQALPALLAELPPIIETVMTVLSTCLPQLIQAGVEILIMLIQGISMAIPTLVAMLPTIIQTVMQVLLANLGLIITSGIQILVALINGLISALPSLIAMVPEIIMTIRITLLENLGVILEAAVQIILALIDGLLSMRGSLITAGLELVTKIVETVKKAPERMLAIGKNIVSGIWSGISNSLSWIKEKLTGWIGNITDFIKKLFKIGSPSKLMADEIGAMLPAGMAQGIEDRTDTVRDALRDLTAEATGDTVLTPRLMQQVSAVGAAAPAENGAGLLEKIIALLSQFIRLYMETHDGRTPTPDALVAYIDGELGRIGAKKARGVL